MGTKGTVNGGRKSRVHYRDRSASNGAGSAGQIGRKSVETCETKGRQEVALLTALDTASNDDVLESDLSRDELNNVLKTEGRRKWNVYVSRVISKRSVIDHIGRYIRKPPIAQYRLSQIDDHHVQYLAKDTKNRRLTPVIYSKKDFVRLLMPHVNDRYWNSMRYFGLLAPRSKMLLTQVFSALKQQQRPRPVPLSYAESICRTFGQNPLIGLDGQPLLRVGHINPLVRA